MTVLTACEILMKKETSEEGSRNPGALCMSGVLEVAAAPHATSTLHLPQTLLALHSQANLTI